jgi:hypothetical protein
MEFEHYGNRVCVAGHVDKVLELIDICIYIVLALKIAVGFQSHEGCCCLILQAEHYHGF